MPCESANKTETALIDWAKVVAMDPRADCLSGVTFEHEYHHVRDAIQSGRRVERRIN